MGPRCSSSTELPDPEPGPGETLIKRDARGAELRGHAHAHELLRAEGDAAVGAGGEVAGVREDTGERVVALVGSGGYAEYAIGARASACSRSPRPSTTAPRSR